MPPGTFEAVAHIGETLTDLAVKNAPLPCVANAENSASTLWPGMNVVLLKAR